MPSPYSDLPASKTKKGLIFSPFYAPEPDAPGSLIKKPLNMGLFVARTRKKQNDEPLPAGRHLARQKPDTAYNSHCRVPISAGV
jgi:hypothetical protein